MTGLLRLAAPLLLVLLYGAAPARAERIDLTDYLVPKPAVGDYRIYAWSRDGVVHSEQRYDVAAVADLANGWRVEWSHNGELYHAEIVRPGAKVRRASVDDSPVPGCRIALDYEVRSCPLRLREGGARSFSRTSLDFGTFPLVRLESRRGRYRFHGLGELSSPYATYAAAAEISSDVRVFKAPVRRGNGFALEPAGPWRLDSVQSRRSWYVEGVGIVGLRENYGPGQPITEMWLREGLVQGLPYP
jgi:hypothetical protein